MSKRPNYMGGARPLAGPLHATLQIHDRIERHPGITVEELFEWVMAEWVIDLGFARRKYAAKLNRENERIQVKYRRHEAFLKSLDGRDATYPRYSAGASAKIALGHADRFPDLWITWDPRTVGEKHRDRDALWHSFTEILTNTRKGKRIATAGDRGINHNSSFATVRDIQLTSLRPLKRANRAGYELIVNSKQAKSRVVADMQLVQACRKLAKSNSVKAASWVTHGDVVAKAEANKIKIWREVYVEKDEYGWEPSAQETEMIATIGQWMETQATRTSYRITKRLWKVLEPWWIENDNFHPSKHSSA